MAEKPLLLASFQMFTIYNIFRWRHKETGVGRFNTFYYKRDKKNGNTSEMLWRGFVWEYRCI